MRHYTSAHTLPFHMTFLWYKELLYGYVLTPGGDSTLNGSSFWGEVHPGFIFIVV